MLLPIKLFFVFQTTRFLLRVMAMAIEIMKSNLNLRDKRRQKKV